MEQATRDLLAEGDIPEGWEKTAACCANLSFGAASRSFSKANRDSGSRIGSYSFEHMGERL
jgi:hypothetical protein